MSYASNINISNFKIFHYSFKNLEKYIGNEAIAGIIYDLGTCSTHFDDPARGFSFNKDGPLDMRFDNSKGNPLSKWINKAPVKEITEVLFKFGNERYAKLIANEICKKRIEAPILRTIDLASLIDNIYPNKNSLTEISVWILYFSIKTNKSVTVSIIVTGDEISSYCNFAPGYLQCPVLLPRRS